MRYNSVPIKDNCALFAPTSLYAAARLHSVAMGQIPRSTERISSFCCLQMIHRRKWGQFLKKAQNLGFFCWTKAKTSKIQCNFGQI